MANSENLQHYLPDARQYEKFNSINSMSDEQWTEQCVICDDCSICDSKKNIEVMKNLAFLSGKNDIKACEEAISNSIKALETI